MKISKYLIQDLAAGCYFSDDFEVVFNELSDTSRWSVSYTCVVLEKKTGKLFRADYSHGATENQDECPYDDYDTDEEGNITLDIEVEAYQEQVIKYRNKENK